MHAVRTAQRAVTARIVAPFELAAPHAGCPSPPQGAGRSRTQPPDRRRV